MKEGDLHIHTRISDGLVSPAEVARRAVRHGLDFFSIADHNSLLGLEAARSALGGDGPELIDGVELSVQPEGDREFHLLGYGFDPDCEELREVCRRIVSRKKEQLLRILDGVRRSGVEVDVADLLDGDDRTYTGRPLIARRMVERGVVPSPGAAFGRFLGEGAPTFVPMRRFDPARAIRAVQEAGGVTVLAHPTIELVDAWLHRLERMGLDGIETYRPRLRGNQQLYIEKAAEHFDLFVTGGSDWHGRPNEDELGAFSVSSDRLTRFFAAIADGAAPGSPATGPDAPPC